MNTETHNHNSQENTIDVEVQGSQGIRGYDDPLVLI